MMQNRCFHSWQSFPFGLLRFLPVATLLFLTFVSSTQKIDASRVLVDSDHGLFAKSGQVKDGTLYNTIPPTALEHFRKANLTNSGPVLIYTDATTVFSASAAGCCPCFCPDTLVSPSPVTYHLANSFFLTGLTVENNDHSCNNHSGFGNLRAQISDINGNILVTSRNTLYCEFDVQDFTFAFDGTLIPQDFKLSIVIVDGLQACAGFTLHNLHFFEDITPVVIQLSQFNPNTTMSIPEGAQTIENPIGFRATVRGFPYQAKLQVELQLFNQAFTNVPNLESQLVPSDTSASVTASALPDGQYHWQARVMDSQGNTSPWQEFGTRGDVDFVVKVTLSFPQVYADTITVFSANNGSQGGCCLNYVMPPSPVTYHLPGSFLISGLTVDNDDFSGNNHDGLGNIRAWILDLNGNPIAHSTNTLWGEAAAHDFTFAFSDELIPRDFKLSFIIDDSLQGGASFTVRNIRFLGSLPPCLPTALGLLSWWQGDGNANDLVGGNNGTIQGSTTFESGVVGQGFHFNGGDGFVQIPDSPSQRPANLTVEAWVKFDSFETPGASAPGLQYIIFKRSTNPGWMEAFTLVKARDDPAGTGLERFALAIAPANGDYHVRVFSMTVIQLGQFYHLALTYDGSIVKLYVNGNLEGQEVANFPLSYNNTKPLLFGTSGEPFDGKMSGTVDEVSIYNRALSGSEIQAIYNAGSAGKCHTIPCASGICVTNVRTRQLTDGSSQVEILYDLNNAPAGGALVTAAFSDNGGATYNLTAPPASLSGDIGPSIPNGTNHRILWSAANTLPPQSFGNSFRSAITATSTSSSTAISNLFSIDLRTQSRKPIASFAFSPQSPAVGQPVQFTDESSGPPASWVWDFNGDGFTDSTSQNPTQTFSTPGPHQVTLSVNNAYGASSLTQTVNVSSSANTAAVTAVRRQYEGVFLQNSIFNNTFDVSINWHGNPGSVRFSVNGGSPVTETGTLSGASHTFHMASDFPARLSPSTVIITPVNSQGMVGTPWIENVYVFPYPTWLQLSGAAVNTVLSTGEINYEVPNFEFPQPHLGSGQNIQLPSVARTLLGSNLGVSDFFGFVRGSFTSRGTGSLKVGGQGGVGAKFNGMESSIDIQIAGSGDISFMRPKGLHVPAASLEFNLEGTISKEVGIVDAIPGLRTLEDKPFIGGAIRFFNERASLLGELKASGGGLWQWQQGADGKFHFAAGTGTLGFDMKGTLRTKLWEKRLSANAWVSGGGSFGIGVPDPFLRTAEVKLQAGAALTLDFWRIRFCPGATWNLGCTWTPEGGWQCDSSGDTTSDCPSSPGNKVSLSLIKPGYERFGKYSLLHSAPLIKPPSSKVPVSVHESSLIDNVYADAAPTLVRVGSGRLLLWTHQDPNLPVEQSTGMAWSFDNGSGWSAPARIVDDTRAEFSPAAAVNNEGKVVAAWLRIKDPAFSTPVTTLNDLPLFYTQLEVVSAVFDPQTQTWGPVTPLTDDTAMDADLRMASDSSGNLLLSWFSNQNADLVSTASSPSILNYSFWNGSAWNTPGAVASGLVGAGNHAAAVHGANAVIVMYRDPDPTVPTDGLLETFAWNGSGWSNATLFAGGGIENRLPSVTYDSAGAGHVVWVRGSDLVHARLDAPTPELVRAGSGSMSFYNAQFLTNAQGNLTLVWQEVVDDGPANLFAVLYDPLSQTWSSDVRLTEDTSEAHDVNGFYSNDGVLNLVYLATNILRTSENVTVGNDVPLVINNIPQEGQTDLRLLEHSLITDLAVVDRDLSLAPQYPLVGETVTANLAVHNAGDFGVGSFAVNLYAGSPEAGGLLLGSTQVAGPFPAGASRILTFSFSYPASGGNIVAVVDSANTIFEFSETNNRATVYLNNTAPQIRLLATPTQGAPPLTVVLDASASFDNENDSMSFIWSFADGSPAANGATVSHLFNRAGLYSVTVAVTDGRGAVATGVVMINVGCLPMTFSPDSLPDAPLGTVYNQTLSANGGISPLSYVVSAGALPPGLSLLSSGAITGTPSSLGAFPFRVTASDVNSCPSDHDYAINVVCDYSLSAVSASFPANGGSDSVMVSSADGCSWTAMSNDGWITLTAGTSGSGNGVVTYTVAANSGPARSGTMTIAGQTFTVNQASGCTFLLDHMSLNFPSTGGTDSVTVTASDANCNWIATSNDTWIMITAGASGSGSGTVNYSVAASQSTSPRSGTLTLAGQTFTVNQAAGGRKAFDFDGDGKADVAVFRSSTGTWYINNSSNGSTTVVVWGTSGDVPVAADYDGDGKTDVAVWRPSNGTWYIQQSSNGALLLAGWGISSDKPVPADYDGDGKTDVAVWRPSNGTWYIQQSSNNAFVVVGWGASGDVPVAGNFDGDGKADEAVFRPSTGTWYINNSSNGSTSVVVWGTSGDVPVATDYDGDGKTDVGVWRPSNGTWYIQKSTNGALQLAGWGIDTDKSAPADYDGDGKADVVVWRPSNGTWYIQQSSNGAFIVVGWGTNGDVPVSGIP